MHQILPQAPSDEAAIEALLDLTFGPTRRLKTAYRLRDGVAPVEALSLVAKREGALVGTIRFWPILLKPDDKRLSARPALLLGPLAVEPKLAGQGIGLALMREGLARAKALGARIVVLVGDLDYYGRVGFSRQPAAGLKLPGPVDPERLLALEIEPGALAGLEASAHKDETGLFAKKSALAPRAKPQRQA